MTLRLIDPPATYPISLAEARAHCRIDGTDDDAWLTTAIASATAAAEHELHRALVTQTWEVVLDAFPASGKAIALPRPRAQSIVSVAYVNAAGASSLMEPEDTVLDGDTMPGWCHLASGASWPITYATANAVRVQFTCGYGAASDVPANIKHWLLLHIGTAYRMRESIAAGIQVANIPNRYVDSLLDAERVYFE